MKSLTYYSHSAQDELGKLLPYEYWQTLQSHSINVGKMEAEFARIFGAQEIACQMGKLHDLGKDSEALNRRLHGGPLVDHATAVARLQKTLALDWSPKYKLASFGHFVNELKRKK